MNYNEPCLFLQTKQYIFNINELSKPKNREKENYAKIPDQWLGFNTAPLNF